MDYKTLLSFARRVGKHNPRAAREAEEDSIRRQQEAKQRAATAFSPATNGVPPAATETTLEVGKIPDNERAWLDEPAAAARSAQGMAFPAAERLRLGMLGQLQYAREQGGEEAVKKELERLMEGSSEQHVSKETGESEATNFDTAESQRQARAQALTNISVANSRPQRPPERMRSVAPLNLDLWNEDEEDDD